LPEWNFDIFASYVVPEDLESAREAFRLGVEHGQFRLQCRIIRADNNSIRWISVRGETFRNELGHPYRMMGTVADITDINEKQEQQRLLAVMKEREDFMATLTHDMENPLIGANRLLELLVERSFGEITNQQSEALRCLKESNSGLLKLIGDLMEVYRFEKDVDILFTANCDLAILVSSCLSQIVPLADVRSVKLISQLPETMPVVVDVSRVKRVVQNLLDNALKFVPDGGTIKIRLFSLDEDTILEIEDNGPGIAAEEKCLLFKRFAQGNAGKRYTSGSGLGLYLCKQIVEAHGGTIECTSIPNEATIFLVSLPTPHHKKILEL
jgi:signal transduction histidine kinase